VIFDCIISSSRHAFSYLSPFIAKCVMCLKNDAILGFRPRRFIDIWVEVVVPPFTALFADTA
jgi:hypothetical protein